MCFVDVPKPKDPPPPQAPVAPIESPKPLAVPGSTSSKRQSSGLAQLRMGNRSGNL